MSSFGPLQALALAAGSVAGGFARFILSDLLVRRFGSAFPWGTLAVNLIGCYLIGVFSSMDTKGAISISGKVLLMTGFCGAFTTFSAFMLDSDSLFRSNAAGRAFLYIGLSVVLGYVFFRLGVLTIKGS